jgi:hypothetical protein
MIGESIFARVPIIDPNKPTLLKLHGVETGGVWIEYEAFTQEILSESGAVEAPRTPVVFLSLDKIDFVVGFVESTVLSEKAFGV